MRTKIRGVLFLLAAALVAPAAHAADAGVATSAGQLPDGFADTLSELARRGAAVQAMSVSNNGDWVVVSDRGVAASPGLPAPLRAAIDDAVRRGQPVEAVAQQGGRWTVVAGGQVSGDLPPDVRQQLLSSVSARRPVAAVALAPGSPDGWAVAAGGELVTGRAAPQGLQDAARAAAQGRRSVGAVALGAGGSWIVAAGGWAPGEGAPAELRAAVDRMRVEEGRSIDQIVLRHNGGWAVYSNGRRAPGSGPDRIEGDLGGRSIYQRMAERQITGLSVAWIDGNRIAWSRSWGVRDAEAPESWVWPWTVFEAASVAKPVTSAATLAVAGSGAIGMMQDISDTGLRLAPDLFGGRTGPMAPARGSGINLYRLLSHCAGLGFAKQIGDVGQTGVEAFGAGERLPNLNQMIAGIGPGGAEYRVVQLEPAGQRVIYSGVNHTLAQALIEDVAPGGFLGHTQRFLTAVGMERSGYAQPMPPAVAREAAAGHRRGRKEPWQARPAAGTDGLWSTAEDLADFVAMLNQRGLAGGRQVVPAPLVDAMLGRDPAINRLCADRRMEQGTMGLGILLDGARVGTRDELYWQQGTHGGYRSYIFGLPGRSQGLAITMSAGARDAEEFSRELLDAFEREYRLPRLPG